VARLYPACFPFPTAPRQLQEQLTDSDVKVVMHGTGVDVAPGERQSRTCGEARDGAAMTAQNDLGCHGASCETNDWRDFFVRELSERFSERQMMGCDVNWQVGHNEVARVNERS
jgi:hypothetical protein